MRSVRGSFVSALVVFATASSPVAEGAVAPYSASLNLDGPVEPGAGQTLTGSGAPEGPGVYVELFRVSAAGTESVASVAAGVGGTFAFHGVDVQEGDVYYVTLSRSWQFDTDGDFEGWDGVYSVDAAASVSGGTLKVRIHDGNGDGFRDPYIQNNFEFNPSYYRVVEIRLRNPAAVTPSRLGVFWGDQPLTLNVHSADIPASMADFETVYVPMNVDEIRIYPEPRESGLDGLWTSAEVHKNLRIDPLNSIQRYDASADGVVVEIDWIRVREDFRLDFFRDGDISGIGRNSGVAAMDVSGGFLNLTAAGGPVDLFFDLATGRLESGHFSHFFIGMDNTVVAVELDSLAVTFDDRDSVDYVDDGGNLQSARMELPFSGRQDSSMVLDDNTSPAGEWTEDGGVPVAGLRMSVPEEASAGDRIRIDYLGFTSDRPYGPSAPLAVHSPNHPPVAIVTVDPADPVTLFGGSAGVTLDGSASHDGDGGTQGLAYRWAKVSGPDGDRIDGAAEAVAGLTFTMPGEYLYELTVDDGQASDSTASTQAVVVVMEEEFVRGDVNADGEALGIGDLIHLFGSLFSEGFAFGDGVELPCPDAADTDDSGAVDLTDAIVMIHYWFDGRLPAAPFPDCGVDPTDDALPACDYPADSCVAPVAPEPGLWQTHDLGDDDDLDDDDPWDDDDSL